MSDSSAVQKHSLFLELSKNGEKKKRWQERDDEAAPYSAGTRHQGWRGPSEGSSSQLKSLFVKKRQRISINEEPRAL